MTKFPATIFFIFSPFLVLECLGSHQGRYREICALQHQNADYVYQDVAHLDLHLALQEVGARERDGLLPERLPDNSRAAASRRLRPLRSTHARGGEGKNQPFPLHIQLHHNRPSRQKLTTA